MNKERPNLVHSQIVLPAWLDRLSARAARWPWWLLVILVLLVTVFYSILTSDFYRRALVFVTDNPQLITDQFANVAYDLRNSDGQITRIRGTITGREGDLITLVTQPETLINIPRSDITSLTCQAPAADGDCPLDQTVNVARGSISGKLLQEDLGKFQIKTNRGNIVDVRKIGVDLPSQVRAPEGCNSNPDGSCQIRLNLKPDAKENNISGTLKAATPTEITVQTAPPVFATIKAGDIVNVVTNEPAQCALNNIVACNEGLFLTIGLTFMAFALAIVLGLIFGLLRISNNPLLFNAATVYVEVVRGIPLLVILLFTGAAFQPWFRDTFPSLVPDTWRLFIFLGSIGIAHYTVTRWSWRRTEPRSLIQPIVTILIVVTVLIILTCYLGANSNLSSVQCGTLGLAFCYGAYLAELFRAGILSIGRGQSEAARSLGMTYFQSMRHIVLPQAFRTVLPPLGNEFIAILKDTSLVAILALPELAQKARLFAAATFRPFEAYITIAVLYLCMTLFLSFLVRVAERRTALPR